MLTILPRGDHGKTDSQRRDSLRGVCISHTNSRQLRIFRPNFWSSLEPWGLRGVSDNGQV